MYTAHEVHPFVAERQVAHGPFSAPQAVGRVCTVAKSEEKGMPVIILRCARTPVVTGTLMSICKLGCFQVVVRSSESNRGACRFIPNASPIATFAPAPQVSIRMSQQTGRTSRVNRKRAGFGFIWSGCIKRRLPTIYTISAHPPIRVIRQASHVC